VVRYNIPKKVGNQFDIHGEEQEDRVVGRREEVEEVAYKMVAGTTGLDKAEVGNPVGSLVGAGVMSPAWFVTEQVLLVQARLQDSVGRPFGWLIGYNMWEHNEGYVAMCVCIFFE
jgi:hypothetical protein